MRLPDRSAPPVEKVGLAADYWTEEQRSTFAAYIAANPEAGDVVSGSGGVRKVRWSYAGYGEAG